MPQCLRCGQNFIHLKVSSRVRCRNCQPSSRRLKVLRKWVTDEDRHLYYINEVYFGYVIREGDSYRCFVDGLMTIYYGILREVRDPTSHRVARVDFGDFLSLDAAQKYMRLLSFKSKWKGKFGYCPCGRVFAQDGLGRPRVHCHVCHPSRARSLGW